MTVTILRRETGQNIARPYSRVSGEAEGFEVLVHAMMIDKVPLAPIAWGNAGTDYPVAAYRTPRGTVVDWFAFEDLR